MHPTSRLAPFAALALSRDGGAVSGFLANITVAAAPEADMPSDDVLKVQISSIGGKVEELEHITTDAGDTVRVGYTLELPQFTLYGVSLSFDAGDEVLSIAVSSTDADEAAEVADIVEAGLVVEG